MMTRVFSHLFVLCVLTVPAAVAQTGNIEFQGSPLTNQSDPGTVDFTLDWDSTADPEDFVRVDLVVILKKNGEEVSQVALSSQTAPEGPEEWEHIEFLETGENPERIDVEAGDELRVEAHFVFEGGSDDDYQQKTVVTPS